MEEVSNRDLTLRRFGVRGPRVERVGSSPSGRVPSWTTLPSPPRQRLPASCRGVGVTHESFTDNCLLGQKYFCFDRYVHVFSFYDLTLRGFTVIRLLLLFLTLKERERTRIDIKDINNVSSIFFSFWHFPFGLRRRSRQTVPKPLSTRPLRRQSSCRGPPTVVRSLQSLVTGTDRRDQLGES